VSDLSLDEKERVLQLANGLSVMDNSTRSVVLRWLHSAEESPAVLAFLEGYLRSDIDGGRRDFDHSERPPLDEQEARVLLDRLRRIAEREEELKQKQLDSLRYLSRLEDSKRVLEHVLRRALGASPVPSQLRDQALKEHSAEAVEALVRELQTAGSFSFEDIMADLNKGGGGR